MKLKTYLKKYKYGVFHTNYGTLNDVSVSGKQLLRYLEKGNPGEYGNKLSTNTLENEIIIIHGDRDEIICIEDNEGHRTGIFLYDIDL